VPSYSFSFTTDPAEFLTWAGSFLGRDPIVNTVVTTMTSCCLGELQDGVAPPEGQPRWWVAIRDRAGEVVSAAMRTAPHPPYPFYLLPMPEQAAVELARAIHDRGEDLPGVNGSRPGVDAFAAEAARLTEGTARIAMHARLFVLEELVEPPEPVGTFRPAVESDVELALEWFAAFHRDADEQAGRPPSAEGETAPDRESMLRRIRAGRLWLWEDEDGRRVHLTGANPAEYGVARIGPVYTPKEARGRGYASATVARVSRLILDEGATPCLFTDQANPTSNRIYQTLGYRPVVDQAHLVIE